MQQVEKEQTKDWQKKITKAESPVLPCLAHVSPRSWKLGWDCKVASGAKVQSLGLDPWPLAVPRRQEAVMCGDPCPLYLHTPL